MAVEATAGAAAGAVVELLLLLLFAAGVGPTADAGADDELKLKPGVIEGPVGFCAPGNEKMDMECTEQCFKFRKLLMIFVIFQISLRKK